MTKFLGAVLFIVVTACAIVGGLVIGSLLSGVVFG